MLASECYHLNLTLASIEPKKKWRSKKNRFHRKKLVKLIQNMHSNHHTRRQRVVGAVLVDRVSSTNRCNGEKERKRKISEQTEVFSHTANRLPQLFAAMCDSWLFHRSWNIKIFSIVSLMPIFSGGSKWIWNKSFRKKNFEGKEENMRLYTPHYSQLRLLLRVALRASLCGFGFCLRFFLFLLFRSPKKAWKLKWHSRAGSE